MNEIKIYLKTSGSFAELYKDFNLYQGCYRNSQISVYVPRSILYANAENTFANLVKVGGILTAPNGTKLTTKSYYLDYVKEETVNTIDYAVYTTITPKEFCVYAGTQTVVVNVENIDNTNAEAPTILSVTTTQTANLIVLESAYLGQDGPIDPTELEKLRATLTVIQENVTELQTSVRGLRGEVSMIETDLEQVHTDLGEKANKDYVDTELGKKLDKTGGPINGDLLVGGELRVLDDTIIIGNLTVHGTTITEDAETIMSKANVIVTNSEGAPLTQLSGIGIRTNATLVYGIMYDPGDDTVKLGEGTLDANNEFTFNPGEGTAVATRADSTVWTNGHLSMWNAAEYRFVDSGIAANNVVTVNTAQQITGAKTFAQAVRVGTGNVYASYYTGGVIWRDSMGNDHANIFPAGSGTLALTSDIPTDYVTQEEFEKAQRSIEDIYTILGQTVILWQSLTQEYTTRETAAGLDIIDGALTEVKEIRGKTVATENLIPFPYAETTKTQNGVTFTVNSDGTITVNGAATKNTSFFLVFENPTMCLNLRAGENYTLSGCPKDGSDTTFSMYVQDISYTQSIIDYGNGATKAISYTQYYAFIRIAEDYTANNLVFKPMLNAGSTAKPYTPYFPGLKNAFFKEIVSTGKNLIDLSGVSLEKTVNGVTSTKISDGQYRVTGTIADPSQGVSSTVNINQGKVYPAGVYSTARYTVDGKDIEFFVSAYSAKTGAPIRNIDGANININEDFVIRSAGIYVNRAITGAIDLTVSTMLNFGSSALPYEPYISDTLSAENPIELAEYDVADTETGETKRQSNTLTFDGTGAWHLTAQSEGYFLMAIGINPHAAESSGDIISNYGENSTPAGAPNNDFGFYIANAYKSALVIWFNNNFYPNVTDLSSAKSQLAAWAEAGDPLTVTYKTAEATTEVTPFNKSRYQAWDGGSETIYQGTNDNSEYGAENTVVQNYATKRGGTTE